MGDVKIVPGTPIHYLEGGKQHHALANEHQDGNLMRLSFVDGAGKTRERSEVPHIEAAKGGEHCWHRVTESHKPKA